MQLEWSAEKEARNLRKHGIAFRDAALVFYDPRRIGSYDGREDYGEDRWTTIGLADWSILYVVYTIREEETVTRIISARKAVPHEQKRYREANH